MNKGDDKQEDRLLTEKTGKNLLLLLIFAISFIYRLLLMTWNVYPPGADIGLHQSVIESIKLGATGFSVNYYHMGGGASATNPGYHIVVLLMGVLTGLPDYLVHAVVSSFFSAFSVLCAFLIVRRIWNESASLIAAFLVAFSAGDIEMLSWGGYPNIIALFLISVVFYFYLQYSRFSKGVYFAVVSLLVGSMFLTHVFSAFVFIAITILALFISALIPRKASIPRQQAISWIVPIVLGAILVSLYLFTVIPMYFGPKSAIISTTTEAKTALLETRVIPIEEVLLTLIPIGLFLCLSRCQKGEWLTTASILFSVWILVPAVMTQGYVFGFFLDYRRFLYFIFFPATICLALLIEIAPRAFSHLQSRLHKAAGKKETGHGAGGSKTLSIAGMPSKATYSVIVMSLLLFSLLFLPIFTPPNRGLEELSYYQVMTPLKYDAIKWIRANTSADAVFVSEAEYGWWLSGFAQRSTLSAVSPQYLILAHELEPAEIARNLLHSKYFIDNGKLQIKYDESVSNYSNLEILARIFDSYFLYHFLSVKDAEMSLCYRKNDTPQYLSFADFPVTNTKVETSANCASFIITREDIFSIFVESITIYSGVRFAKISFTLLNKVPNIHYDWLHIPIMTRGAPMQYANSIAFVDVSAQALSQLIFPEEQLGTEVTLLENPDFFELVINLGGKSIAKIDFFAGVCSYQSSEISQSHLQSIILSNSEKYLDSTSDLPLKFFDYKAAIKAWNISYVAITSAEIIPRFAGDSFFSLAYKNTEVAIFKVNEYGK